MIEKIKEIIKRERDFCVKRIEKVLDHMAKYKEEFDPEKVDSTLTGMIEADFMFLNTVITIKEFCEYLLKEIEFLGRGRKNEEEGTLNR